MNQQYSFYTFSKKYGSVCNVYKIMIPVLCFYTKNKKCVKKFIFLSLYNINNAWCNKKELMYVSSNTIGFSVEKVVYQLYLVNKNNNIIKLRVENIFGC